MKKQNKTKQNKQNKQKNKNKQKTKQQQQQKKKKKTTTFFPHLSRILPLQVRQRLSQLYFQLYSNSLVYNMQTTKESD